MSQAAEASAPPAKEGALPPQPTSETAATRGKRLYGRSKAMSYRVIVSNGSALFPHIVNAKTGDEAAARALAANPGCKVTKVAPESDPDWVDASALLEDFDDE